MALRLALTVCLLVGAGCPEDAAVTGEIEPIQAPASQVAIEALSPPRVDELCRLSGAKDEILTCPLHWSADAPGVFTVAALQVTLSWDPALLAYEGLVSKPCTPEGVCLTVHLPPASALVPTGHSVVTNPPSPAQAAGKLTMMIVHKSKPGVLLPSDPGSLRFRLLEATGGAKTCPVRVDELTVTSVDAVTLPSSMHQGRITVGAPGP